MMLRGANVCLNILYNTNSDFRLSNYISDIFFNRRQNRTLRGANVSEYFVHP